MKNIDFKFGKKYKKTKTKDGYLYRNFEIKNNKESIYRKWEIIDFPDEMSKNIHNDFLYTLNFSSSKKLKDTQDFIDKIIFVSDNIPPLCKSSEDLTDRAIAIFDILVPSMGAANTIQGELIRADFKISDESFRNLNMNFIYGMYEANTTNREDDWWDKNDEGEPWEYKKDSHGKNLPLELDLYTLKYKSTYMGETVKSLIDIFSEYGKEMFSPEALEIIIAYIDIAVPEIPLGVGTIEELEKIEKEQGIEFSLGRDEWQDTIISLAIDYFIANKTELIKRNEKLMDFSYVLSEAQEKINEIYIKG